MKTRSKTIATTLLFVAITARSPSFAADKTGSLFNSPLDREAAVALYGIDAVDKIEKDWIKSDRVNRYTMSAQFDKGQGYDHSPPAFSGYTQKGENYLGCSQLESAMFYMFDLDDKRPPLSYTMHFTRFQSDGKGQLTGPMPIMEMITGEWLKVSLKPADVTGARAKQIYNIYTQCAERMKQGLTANGVGYNEDHFKKLDRLIKDRIAIVPPALTQPFGSSNVNVNSIPNTATEAH